MADAQNIPKNFLDENGQPAQKYISYLQHRQAWEESKNAYDKAYEAALENPLKLQMWPMQGKMFQDAVDAAMSRWRSAGYKDEVEKSL